MGGGRKGSDVFSLRLDDGLLVSNDVNFCERVTIGWALGLKW